MDARSQLNALQDQLAALRAGSLGASAFSTVARSHSGLLQTLPPRYGEVLLGLLDRLESSALFSDESCSFSQKDLLDNIELWTTKAAAQLDTPAPQA